MVVRIASVVVAGRVTDKIWPVDKGIGCTAYWGDLKR